MKKNIIVVSALLVCVVGLVLLSKYLSPNQEKIALWNSQGVECLKNGHTNLLQHIHQNIEVVINGVSVPIPENIGLESNCLAEIHTHAGEEKLIHVESAQSDKKFKLNDFFMVWGEPFVRNGTTPVVLVDQVTSTEGGNLILEDKQIIKLIYVDSPEKKAE